MVSTSIFASFVIEEKSLWDPRFTQNRIWMQPTQKK